LDKDKDGSITREELIEGVVRMLCDEDRQHGERPALMGDMLVAPAAAAASSCPAVHLNVEELFLVMDRNSSGTIDYQEFTHFYDMVLQSSCLHMERQYQHSSPSPSSSSLHVEEDEERTEGRAEKHDITVAGQGLEHPCEWSERSSPGEGRKRKIHSR
jgi:hypothetical protein